MTEESSDTLEPYATHDFLAEALAKAQGTFTKIERTREVDVKGKEGRQGYKFKYAPLATVMAAVQPALTANNLAITHRLSRGVMFSRLRHMSGQFEESEFPISTGQGMSPQGVGSLLTYGQRYNVKLLLNLTSDEDDDDGNESMGNQIDMRDTRPTTQAAATTGLRTARREIQSGTASTVPQKGPAVVAPSDALAKRVKEWVETSVQGFSLLPTREAMREWWGDPASISRRETAKAHYPDDHQRLCEAYDLRLEALAAKESR